MHDLGASNVCDRRSFVARERRWSHRPLSLCRVCLSSQISILARCEIQIFEAERLAFVCDSVNYVLTSSVQLSPIMTSRSSSQLLRLRLEVDRDRLMQQPKLLGISTSISWNLHHSNQCMCYDPGAPTTQEVHGSTQEVHGSTQELQELTVLGFPTVLHAVTRGWC